MASIEISEEHGVRYLHFGSHLVQGAMRIARPWSLELEYTREMMMPLLLRSPPAWPGNVLQVGLGSASLTRFLYRHRPESKITVVQFDEQLLVKVPPLGLPSSNSTLPLNVALGARAVPAAVR